MAQRDEDVIECEAIKKDGKKCTAASQDSFKYCRRHMKGPKEPKTSKRRPKIKYDFNTALKQIVDEAVREALVRLFTGAR